MGAGKIEYVPSISPARDGRLLELLPDYLTESIEFYSDQGGYIVSPMLLTAAGIFYDRLSSCL
jgi:hypothetical protein